MSNTITIQNSDGTVTHRQMTPQEIAALKSQIHYNQMNQAFNQGYAQVQQGSGYLNAGPGGVTGTTVKQSKQPQDKVLRLVTSREHKNNIVTSCVIWIVYMCVFVGLAGAVVNEGKWLTLPAVLLPVLLGAGFAWAYVRKFFKEAEARADLLDWPEQ